MTSAIGSARPESASAARAARLRWVSDSKPGIRRDGKPGAFRYTGPDGRRITDSETLERIRAIVIPPAWTDVWIFPMPDGHIQATGRDARRRKQYRYHARWREVRDEQKYSRLLDFGAALPDIRARVASDLSRRDLSQERVLATVTRLLDLTHLRVGNEEYVRENDSYGLTTLRADQVSVNGSRVSFHVRGKSGVQHDVFIEDRRMARIVARIQDLPGEELFEWRDENDRLHPITADQVNEYLRDVSGGDFTSKDFRTWAGTVLAWCALRQEGPAESAAAAKRLIVAAVKQVSGQLGNTPAVARRNYIHPDVITAYTDGSLFDAAAEAVHGDGRSLPALSDPEAAVLRLLRSMGPADQWRSRKRVTHRR